MIGIVGELACEGSAQCEISAIENLIGPMPLNGAHPAVIPAQAGMTESGYK